MLKVTELAGDFRVGTGSQLSWLPDQSHSFTQQMFTKHLFVLGIRLGSGDRAVNKIDAVPAHFIEETDNKWQNKYLWALLSYGGECTLVRLVPTF